MIMLQVATAKAWGMKPSQFGDCSDEDKAYMIGLEEVNGDIASSEALIADQLAEKAKQKNKPRKHRGRQRR